MKTEIEKLRMRNPSITILDAQGADREAFRPYGRILEGIDGQAWFAWVRKNLEVAGATQYQGSIPELEGQEPYEQLSREFFGGLDIQAGCCWGKNSALNGMEFHKTSEVLGAQTSMILFLGRRQEVREGRWDTAGARAFYLPAGSWVELYATTMHLAPCRVDAAGFRGIIVLPRGTNQPLDRRPQVTDGKEESQWLFAVNKWMICHPESPQAAKGAWTGLDGENLEIKPLED